MGSSNLAPSRSWRKLPESGQQRTERRLDARLFEGSSSVASLGKKGPDCAPDDRARGTRSGLLATRAKSATKVHSNCIPLRNLQLTQAVGVLIRDTDSHLLHPSARWHFGYRSQKPRPDNFGFHWAKHQPKLEPDPGVWHQQRLPCRNFAGARGPSCPRR